MLLTSGTAHPQTLFLQRGFGSVAVPAVLWICALIVQCPSAWHERLAIGSEGCAKKMMPT